MNDHIIIKNARLHNLKNISLSIPKNKLVVITGVSGSGKSTLAFDTLHKEGQRQYLESMGMVTDYLSKPEVDSIQGLSPSISVDQHLTNRSPRSTVGTATEVYTYLRVLFARVGEQPCPHCGQLIPPAYAIDEGTTWHEQDDDAAEPGAQYPCPHCGTAVSQLSMSHFSFNKPAGACPTCTGLGEMLQANLALLIDEHLSILDGGVIRWDKHEIARYQKTLQVGAAHFGFSFNPAQPIHMLGEDQRELLFYGISSPKLQQKYPNITLPETASNGRFEGIAPNLLRRYAENPNASYREKMNKFLLKQTCPDCQGTRLKRASRAVTIAGKTIIDLSQLSLIELASWLEQLPKHVSDQDWTIVNPIWIDLRERLQRLLDVGVGYLTLERSSPTLSAGEAQRLRLASLLGSGLTGVLYVLDEPTTGLHQRDTEQLLQVLQKIRDLGNTILVIEHDIEVFRNADYIIDIGPGGGHHGGNVVAAGTPQEIAANTNSTTGEYLSGRLTNMRRQRRRRGNGKQLIIKGAREHNLKNIDAHLPLNTFIAITGLSGSGKSSLMFDILDRAGRQHFNHAAEPIGTHDRITGWEYLDKIITIDQSAIGRTPRSNAATYTDVFTAIRQTFAATPAAQQKKLTARHFSFNVVGGRCERCQGAGELTIEMHFLPDVMVRCPTCNGRRFNQEILSVHYKGLTIADVLDLTIEEASTLFADVPAAASRLTLMEDVGLGYLKLGQPANTLSGGEAQRIKLAKELGRRATGSTLYLLDEPTTGLHPADVAHLLTVLQGLVDQGHTVAVVEHNMDIIQNVDWVIDLGPAGGDAGGEIVAIGTPEEVAQSPDSYTGHYLSLSSSIRTAKQLQVTAVSLN